MPFIKRFTLSLVPILIVLLKLMIFRQKNGRASPPKNKSGGPRPMRPSGSATRFYAAYDRAGIKISTKQTEALCLSRKPRQCMLQVNGNTQQQVENFKYLGVLFTRDGRRNEEIDTGIGKAHAFLSEINHSMVRKRELSNTVKLSVFKSVFFPILTNCHESLVMADKILS